MAGSAWFLDDEMEELYQTRLWYSDVVSDYEDLVRPKDLVLGYRLHGNLMALANRTPSIYFSYDSRTVEFAETFAIPCYDVFSHKPFVLEEYWDQARFDASTAHSPALPRHARFPGRKLHRPQDARRAEPGHRPDAGGLIPIQRSQEESAGPRGTGAAELRETGAVRFPALRKQQKEGPAACLTMPDRRIHAMWK